MRFAKFWKMQVFDLSLTERMFYRDAIRTLQAWKPLKEEFADLDLIRQMLDEEIQLPDVNHTALPEAILGNLLGEGVSLELTTKEES